MIRVCQKKYQPLCLDRTQVDVTSHTSQEYRQLSPFYLGPVETYGGLTSMTMENAWQYSKVYPCHADRNENPTGEYFTWRNNGYQKNWADRHPMGRQRPLYSLWKQNGEYVHLGYIDARKQIYIPLYAANVVKTESYRKLKQLYDETGDITLYDFDAYDHNLIGMSYADIIDNPLRIMGHGFVLAMLLDGYITVSENGCITIGSDTAN